LWLPDTRFWPSELEKMRGAVPSPHLWAGLRQLANSNLDFVRTVQLDRQLCRLFPEPPVGPDDDAYPRRDSGVVNRSASDPVDPYRGLRADIWCSVYETRYGQYYQELTDTDSALHRFRPTAILMALDSRHAVSGAGESTAEVAENALLWMEGCWRIASEQFGCEVMRQSLLPVLPGLLGSNEHRLGSSRRRDLQIVNELLRQPADAGNVHLVAIDDWAALDGLDVWRSPSLWHTAKQEIDPRQAPSYGELVGRLLAALQGRSKKCLVLDLDNTLWGGVIADDGVAGIVLAVCSKNEHAAAFKAFTDHPRMVLKPADIACFRANWADKATSICEITETLNISLDSFVFVDDNTAERALVRAELHMVAVPELPDDPAVYATLLAQSG
jgi:predicted enzyme involved in methoxymalonyl-ACP biosynthesis